jgi:hypothetical protein
VTCGPSRALRARALAATAILSLSWTAACRAPAAGDCADVETLRICWDRAGPHVMGSAAAAVRRGPAFACDGSRCAQRHPRMPDDGEWQCADSAGATICVGGERPAGVAPAPADPRWLCGARRGGPPGARVCVDLSPDFPDGGGGGWRCRTLYDGPTRRVCDRAPDAHTLGDPCDPARPCVDGSRCADGRCVPDRPAPACWLDGDCPGGRCRFGSCVGAGA